MLPCLITHINFVLFDAKKKIKVINARYIKNYHANSNDNKNLYFQDSKKKKNRC